MWPSTLGLPPVLGTQSPAEKLAPLGVAGYRVEGAWVGKTIHQAWYWAIMWTNSWAVVSAVGRLLTDTMPYIWTVKILIYKRGLCFLSYLTLIIILPDRSYLCYTHEIPKRGEVTHVTFPMWLPSPGVLWSSPARNPLSPKENTAAFVIKNHRHMGLYLSKANYKETVAPRFLWYDYKMRQHPNEEMDKKHVRPPLPHLLGLLGLCSRGQRQEAEVNTEGRGALGWTKKPILVAMTTSQVGFLRDSHRDMVFTFSSL